MLRQDDTNYIVGSMKIQRRDSILVVLDKVEAVEELAASASNLRKVKDDLSLRSGGYFLVKGERIGSSHNGNSYRANKNTTNISQNKYDLWHYLRDICTKSADNPPRSSIYFPENIAGPDLIFALEPAGTRTPLNKRILYVI